MRAWFMVFVGSLALLLISSGAANFLDVDARVLLTVLGGVALLSLLLGVISRLHKANLVKTGQLAGQIGAEHVADVPDDFLNQFRFAPWRQWTKARSFSVYRILRSREQRPAFWVFDLSYKEGSSSKAVERIVTMAVVALAASPSEHAPMPAVPKGYTAVASHGLLYFWRSTSWFNMGDRLAHEDVAGVLDRALAYAAQLELLAGEPQPAVPPQPSTAARSLIDSVLVEVRIVLITLGWALVAGVAVFGGRGQPNMLVVPLAIVCVAWGHVWRSDRSPAMLIFPAVCAVTLYQAAVLFGLGDSPRVVTVGASAAVIITLFVAMFGVKRIAAGQHVGVIAGVALTVAGYREGSAFMLYGIPIGLCLLVVLDFFVTSRTTKWDRAGKLVWNDGR